MFVTDWGKRNNIIYENSLFLRDKWANKQNWVAHGLAKNMPLSIPWSNEDSIHYHM